MSEKKKRVPGKRCVVMFCNKTNADGVSLHQFPKDRNLSRKWTSFVIINETQRRALPVPGTFVSPTFQQMTTKGTEQRSPASPRNWCWKKGQFHQFIRCQLPINSPLHEVLLTGINVPRPINKKPRVPASRAMQSLVKHQRDVAELCPS